MMRSADQIEELQIIMNELPLFVAKLTTFAARLGLNLTDFHADHISLRCNNVALAEQWRQGFLQCGTLLSDKEINGRPIYLFTLEQPITVGSWRIKCIELPYPTKKIYSHQGWEHIEIVLPGSDATLIERAQKLLPNPLPEGISTKISHPKGEGERLPNPTLAVSNGEITIKFHPYTLSEIVESERQLA